VPFQSTPGRVPAFRTTDPGGCPKTAALRTDPPKGLGRSHSGSGRMPFATALRTDSSPTSSPTPETSRLPYPWPAARIRDELEVAFPRSSLRSPQRHRADVRLAPHYGSTLPADSARVASDPHRALEATGCDGLPLPSAPVCTKTATLTQVPARTDGDVGLSSEEPAPNRSTHGHATQFAPHCVRPNGSSHRRCRRQRPSAIVGWRSLARKRVVQDSARRREASFATFDPTRCSELAPRGPARRRNTFGVAQPTAELDHRPETRSLLTVRAARRCCHLRAARATNRLPTHSTKELRATLATRKPPLSLQPRARSWRPTTTLR
jgi:hypothetical protein